MALLLLGVAPAAASVVEPAAVGLAVAWDVVLLLAFLWDAHRAGTCEVSLVREAGPLVSVGEDNPVRLRATSFSARHLVVRVADRPPEDARREGDARATLALPPFGRREAAYTLIPLRRGDQPFGEASLAVRGPLGLAWRERPGAAAVTLAAEPGLRALKRLRLAALCRDPHRFGFRPVRREGGGYEFEALREYSPDDDFRRVDWKATARRDRPITRVYEAERSQNVVLALDCGRTMSARCGELTRLDAAVDAAVVVARAALDMDDRVGLLLFSDRVHVWLPPRKGRRQFTAVLQALRSAEAGLTWVDWREAARTLLAQLSRRSLLCLFTDLPEPAQAEALARSVRTLAARHLPLVATTEDPRLLAVRRGVPEDVDTVYRRVVAGEVAEERAVLRRGLERAGARVLATPPGELTAGSVNEYVRIKRAGAL